MLGETAQLGMDGWQTHVSDFPEYVGHYISSLVQNNSSYVKSTNLMVPKHLFLFSIDIHSLYTNSHTKLRFTQRLNRLEEGQHNKLKYIKDQVLA